MNRASVCAFASVALLSAGCAGGRRYTPLTPQQLASAGEQQYFGPGLVAIARDGRHVTIDLSRRANVWFFNVHRDGWVELLRADALRAGCTDVALPLHVDEQAPGRRTRRGVSYQFHPSVRQRDGLLVVIWERGRDPEPGPFASNYRQFRLVHAQDPATIPEYMFGGQPARWVAFMLRAVPADSSVAAGSTPRP